MKSYCLGIIILLFIVGCGGSSENEKATADAVSINNNVDVSTSEGSKTDENITLLGMYHGVQQSYYLKNQFGNDMEVNGNKISVPSIDYKFILKEGSIVTLQQINLEDNSRIYYHGSFSVDKNNSSIKIICKLTDDHSSNPTYCIEIDKSTNLIKCFGNNEPEFSLERNSSSTSPVNEPKVEKEISVDGTYSYNDESVKMSITINGDSWIGKTTIISGLGDEYDKPEYQSGIVNGQDLYESSGMAKIGYVNGRNLTTSIGNNQVILSK